MELRPSPKTTPVAAWGASFGRAATPQDFGIEWNAENLLVRVTKDAAEVARFGYDPLGRRVEKAAGGTTTAYAHSREDILRETGTTGSVRYVHGPGIDEMLAAENDAGQLLHEHTDALGSELGRSDGTGTVTSTRTYDVFGQPQVGAATGGYAFTGREWDPEVHLAHYRARYYDPRAGRFASEDPIGFLGGLNLYQYVRNAPTVYIDPLGLLGDEGRPRSEGGKYCDFGACVPFPPPPQGGTNMAGNIPVGGSPATTVNCIQAAGRAGGLGYLLLTGQVTQRNGDKTVHCLAHCFIRKGCGPVFGNVFSPQLGYGKEYADQIAGSVTRAAGMGPSMMRRQKWSWPDIDANEHGRTCPADQDCTNRCASAPDQFPE